MWRLGRRRDAVADAIVHVVHQSIVNMRAIARTSTTMCDEDFPGTSYQEQIRLLADLCDTLVPGLGPGRRRDPVEALRYTWHSRNDMQRQWITRCLAMRDINIADLIDTRLLDDQERDTASPRPD